MLSEEKDVGSVSGTACPIKLKGKELLLVNKDVHGTSDTMKHGNTLM